MASTSISKTFRNAGNRQKWTWSAWIKRANLTNASNGQTLWNCEGSNANDNFIFQIDGGGGSGGATDSIALHTYGNDVFRTTPLLRDVSAWYHIVLALDTTQATATNRIKLYVNGTLQSYSQEANFPSQNYNMGINRAAKHCVGSHGTNANYYFDGSMSHIHFCDGYQYAASDFGETDSTTGEWKIKTSPSVSYGTNGFWILKDGNSLTDQSPNSNNFSSNGGTLTKTEDSPSNVFATGNNLATYWTAATFANGNTTQTTQSNNYSFNTSTLGFKTGKWYWEAKIVSSAQSDMFGITGRTNSGGTTHELGKYADQYAFNSYSGVSRTNSTDTSYASQFNSNGTIVQIAVDMTNLKIHLGLNGVWQNSSNPSNNTGGLAIGAISTTTDGYYFVGIGDYSNGAGTYSYNFGNGYFGTTAVSSAGTNASGNGIFEYDVPTGYTALSTKGLNL